MEWKLAEAKNKLSELVTRATSEGPQTIRRNGVGVIVVAEETYLELTGQRPSFKQWLLEGPRIDDLELPSRDPSPMREVDL
ncbi:Phd_YefM [Pirellulimonas nuda]|uniref:Antitoxin n=1 Tax=Pirellulimonas nuda TaxID=2528009 RepID=A0A518DHM1_9BACT|nr:type II toxin-antitoxin system prevent-host-death family antitoxin [Pirellulimonas nuda]QDU90977.1 Phd_YefM [Pirellulimonas nuda]